MGAVLAVIIASPIIMSGVWIAEKLDDRRNKKLRNSECERFGIWLNEKNEIVRKFS